MKARRIFLFLAPLTASADLLTDSTAFLASSEPEYEAEDFSPVQAGADPVRAPFSPADSDFGVQQILGSYDGPPPVKTFAYFSWNYTDNAPALTNALEDKSSYVSGLIGASWKPRLAAGWFADLGLSQEIYRFEEADALDFENFRTHAGVAKLLVDWDDTVFYARHEYQRLTTTSFNETDYSAQRIRAGLQKSLFSRAHQQLAIGLSAAADIDANPERLERNEYAAEVSYTYWLRSDLSATASWRAAYWDFDNRGREDWNHTAGVELSWNFHRNATAYTQVVFTRNDSNTPLGINDFEAWTGGVGLGLNYSF
jgi:hypothetical protein